MIRGCAAFAAAMVLAAGLQAAPARAQDAAGYDPLESWNRAIHSFNETVGGSYVGAITNAYRTVVPTPVQAGVDNVFTNLREPLTAVSSGLKGDFRNAGVSAGRFAVNSTVGLGGIFDVATEMDLVARPEDFGTAMCSYDVPAGPYLVLPFLGPTTTRDAVGRVTVYVATFGLLEEAALPYLFADRWAALAADGPVGELETRDVYAEDKARYLELRRRLCEEQPPAETLKPSPLGGIVEQAADTSDRPEQIPAPDSEPPGANGEQPQDGDFDI